MDVDVSGCRCRWMDVYINISIYECITVAQS